MKWKNKEGIINTKQVQTEPKVGATDAIGVCGEEGVVEGGGRVLTDDQRVRE